MIYEMLAEHEKLEIVKYNEIEALLDSKLENAVKNFSDSFRFIVLSI